MKIATINEMKSCLNDMDKEKLVDFILRLVKYKTDNKQLLHYLLFEDDDTENYTLQIKKEIDLAFRTLHETQFYLAKKTIRKAIKIANKYIRICKEDVVEVEVLFYLCIKIKASPFTIEEHAVLNTIYQGLTKRILKTISEMHEDLQYDYKKQFSAILN